MTLTHPATPDGLAEHLAPRPLFGLEDAKIPRHKLPDGELPPFIVQPGDPALMLDVPASRYQEVRGIIARTHPEAVDGGKEPAVPAFP